MNIRPSLHTGDEVDRRLRIVSELRNLCLSLGKAGREAELARSTPRLPETPAGAAPPEQGDTAGNAH